MSYCTVTFLLTMCCACVMRWSVWSSRCGEATVDLQTEREERVICFWTATGCRVTETGEGELLWQRAVVSSLSDVKLLRLGKKTWGSLLEFLKPEDVGNPELNVHIMDFYFL